MAADLLAGASWSCAAAAPGAVEHPDDLDHAATTWLPASVPGTAAGALRAAGQWTVDDDRDFDVEDWWFRCRVPDLPLSATATDGPWRLSVGGVATVADVWVAGRHVIHSENMFRAHVVTVASIGAGDEVVIRCHALAPLLATKRPRPRWKTRLVHSQNLRWFRTALVGRIPGWAPRPAPVGPWRPVRLVADDGPAFRDRHLVATCDGTDGVVTLTGRVAATFLAGTAAPTLRVGDTTAELDVMLDGEDAVVRGSVTVACVERWWPHSHGPQPRYAAALTVGDHTIDLGHVGFRTVAVDETAGGFTLLVNGEPVFCRGACWVPPDIVSLAASAADVRAALELARDGGMNMVRLTGTMVYEDGAFWDACDELGILVWQDAMFANTDPPDDDTFVAEVDAELQGVLTGLQGRPSLAVVCGGSEVQQQAAMLGLEAERWTMPLFDRVLPALVADIAPGVPYVPSSPAGGDLPFRVDTGVSHYFGVGAYLRPLDDARRAGVRFTSECLAFSNPPERETVEEAFVTASPAGHDPAWKRRVPRDAGASWDFEDVRDHYVAMLFGIDPTEARLIDPERALDIGRATVAHVMATTMAEWRRPASGCAGALVYTMRDLRPGAGWGVVDALGRPKSSWFALRRVQQPRAILASDEGLNGLRLHVLNDCADALMGRVRVELFARGEMPLEQVEIDVRVDGRGSVELSHLFDGFRDLTYAYRFGSPAHDVVVASLVDDRDALVSRAVYLPLGLARALEADIGLHATAKPLDGGDWLLVVETRRFAQSVAVDVPGFRPDDSWFDLPPGATASIVLHPVSERTRPSGEVRALNSTVTASISVES